MLQPRDQALIVDGTFGAGGYARALLERGANVVAIDRDPSAIRRGTELVATSGGRLRLVEARFGDLGAVAQALGLEKADGIVFDVGVSSMQFDEAERGFSLRFDAPLDMRMEGRGRSAADILLEEDEATIADILFHFGEERAARRIARAIVADRITTPFVSTLQLANMVARVAPARRGELTHPATRTFQALRIAVNDELGELLRGLAAAEGLLKPGRAARGGDLPFARRSHRQALPWRPFRPGARRVASASRRAGRDRAVLLRSARPADRAGRRRGRGKSALAIGEAPLRHPARSAGAGGRKRAFGADANAGASAGEARMMWRLLHAIAIAALIASAVYVYGVKYRTIYASEQLVKTRHLIAREKDAINLLRAEYAHLARPDRLQALADAKLGFQPLALSQIATVEELPESRPKVDSIGRELESLGFIQDNAAPAAPLTDDGGATPTAEMTMDQTPDDAGLKTARRARGAGTVSRAVMAFFYRSAHSVRDAAAASRRSDAGPKSSSPRRRTGPASRAVIAVVSPLRARELRRQPRTAGAWTDRARLCAPCLTFANAKAFVHALLLTRLDRSGARIRMLALGMFAAYATLGVKLVVLGVSHDPPQTLKGAADQAVSGARPDLLDRNGEILATDVKTMSVFAEPNRIIDKDEAVELITAVLPDVDAKELRERLGSRKGFVWVKRQITPKEQAEIFHLGLPGVGFLPENKRVYPNGPIGAHVLGYVDKDNVGIAGMEKYLDEQSLTDPHVPGFVVDPESLKPVRLSLDLRLTHALRDELMTGIGPLSGQGRGRNGHGRQYRRGARARISAGLRSQPADRRARSLEDQSDQRRRLRDGLDLQGAVDLHGARVGQGQSGLAHRRARFPCAMAASPSTISTRPIAY